MRMMGTRQFMTVVPAKAGTHNLFRGGDGRTSEISDEDTGVWVPAFAGTTKEATGGQQ
jgi:hypothetical protein